MGRLLGEDYDAESWSAELTYGRRDIDMMAFDG